MSTLFPVAELLMIVLFAATVVGALTKTGRGQQRASVGELGPELSGEGRRTPAPPTDTDFPSTAVC